MSRFTTIVTAGLLAGAAAHAQSYRPQGMSDEALRDAEASLAAPRRQNLALQLGIGGVTGYFAASAGLTFERFLDRGGYLSATLTAGGYKGGTVSMFSEETGAGQISARTTGLFLAPGLRAHLFGNEASVDVGLGLFAPMGMSTRTDAVRFAYSSRTDAGVRSQGYFGALVGELTLSFFRDRHPAFSIFANAGSAYARPAGVTYTAPYSTSVTLSSRGTPGFILLGVRLGIGW